MKILRLLVLLLLPAVAALGQYSVTRTYLNVVQQPNLIFTTPNIGAATATSINGNTFTAGTYTLTGAAAKVLTFSNTLTLTGTDGSSVAFGTGGTVAYTGNLAPANADYLVKTGDAGLSAERVVTDTATIVADWTGPGQVGFNFANQTSSTFFGYITNETGGTGFVVGSQAPTIDTVTLTGVSTADGSTISAPAAMGALAMDITKRFNSKSISVDSTLTFSASGASGQMTSVWLTNSDTAAHAITVTGGTPSSFTIAASTKNLYTWWRDSGGSTWLMAGGPPTINDLATVTIASGDFLTFWDISGGVTGKATLANILGAGVAGVFANVTDSALTSGRVTFASTAGLLVDDADMTFATDTLTVAKIIGSTSITNSALTSTRVVFSGASGIQSDDSDLTFATDTLTMTKGIASTNFDVSATGVRLTGSNGSITWLGLGSGSDEDLKLDLDTTSNQATVTSSTGVVTLSLGAIGLTSTGTNSIGPLVDSVDGTTPLNNVIATYGAGTAYVLTNTAAAVDFGTTDPVITLSNAGTYLLQGQFVVQYNAGTVVAETATFKIRRTNNTAADLSQVVVVDLPVATTLTYCYGIVTIPPVKVTTANTNDSVTLFANVSAALGAGSIDITSVGTGIIATRLY